MPAPDDAPKWKLGGTAGYTMGPVAGWTVVADDREHTVAYARNPGVASVIIAATAMAEALAAHDAYMLASGYSGPDSDALHPNAAANWRQIRAALAIATRREQQMSRFAHHNPEDPEGAMEALVARAQVKFALGCLSGEPNRAMAIVALEDALLHLRETEG